MGRLKERGEDTLRLSRAFCTPVDGSANGADSPTFAPRLLTGEMVPVAPGSGFGAGGGGFIRISLAVSERYLEDGRDRVAALWNQIGAVEGEPSQ